MSSQGDLNLHTNIHKMELISPMVLSISCDTVFDFNVLEPQINNITIAIVTKKLLTAHNIGDQSVVVCTTWRSNIFSCVTTTHPT